METAKSELTLGCEREEKVITLLWHLLLCLMQWFPTFFVVCAPTALSDELMYPFNLTCCKCAHLNWMVFGTINYIKVNIVIIMLSYN